MEGNKTPKLVINNPTVDLVDDSRSATGTKVIVPPGVRLDASLAELQGSLAFNGGTGGVEYRPVDAKGHLGADQGISDNTAISRVRGSEAEVMAIEKSVAGLTEVDIPQTAAQQPAENLSAVNTRRSTVSKSSQHMVIAGGSGTSPNKGVPIQVYTEDVLLHDEGMFETYGEGDAKPSSEVLYDAFMKKGAVSSVAKEKAEGNYDYEGRSNVSGQSEGSYLLQGFTVTVKEDGSWSWTPNGLTSLQTKVTPHTSMLRDSKRTRTHNQFMAEMEWINANTSDNRSGKYCPFNSKTKRFSSNRSAYYWYRLMTRNTGNNVFAAWNSAIRSNAFMRYKLTLDGRREDTFIGESFLNRSHAFSSADHYQKSAYESLDARFHPKHWMMGSVFNTVLLHESDKKFTDKHSKTPALTQDKNHIHAFCKRAATSALGVLRADPEFVEAMLESCYYTFESSTTTNRLFLTDAVGITFPYDITKEFVGSDRVHPEPKRGGDGNSMCMNYSSTKTYPFASVWYVTGDDRIDIMPIYNPLFEGIRRYFDAYAAAWYAKLQRKNIFASGTKSVSIYVPATFSTTQPSLFATIIAEAIEFIADEYNEMSSPIAGWYSENSDGSSTTTRLPFESEDTSFTTADGHDVTIKAGIPVLRALEKESRHYSRSADTAKVLFHGITPGVFDPSGSDYLHWFNRDMFTKINTDSIIAKSKAQVDTQVQFDVIEGPAYAGATDYAWDKSRIASWVNKIPTADADWRTAFPKLMYRYSVHQIGVNTINVPYRSTLSCFGDVSTLSNIPAISFYRQNRILSPFTIPSKGDHDEYIGIPLSSNSNSEGTGRLCCAVPRAYIEGTKTPVPINEGAFSLKWYLELPRNNSVITPLPRSPWFSEASTTGSKMVVVTESSGKLTGAITVTPISLSSTSILNCSGISIYSWRKEHTATDDLYTVYSEKSNVSYLTSWWDRWDMNNSAAATFWKVPACMAYIPGIQPINQIIAGTTAWASGMIGSDSIYQASSASGTPYAEDAFHASDSHRVVFRDVDEIFDTEVEKAEITFKLPVKDDYAYYVYGKTWLFRDPLCMFDRVVDSPIAGSCNHDAWLEMNGFAGWVAQDYSAAAEVATSKTVDLGSGYIDRVRESGVITALQDAGQANIEQTQAQVDAAESQTGEPEGAR